MVHVSLVSHLKRAGITAAPTLSLAGHHCLSWSNLKKHLWLVSVPFPLRNFRSAEVRLLCLFRYSKSFYHLPVETIVKYLLPVLKHKLQPFISFPEVSDNSVIQIPDIHYAWKYPSVARLSHLGSFSFTFSLSTPAVYMPWLSLVLAHILAHFSLSAFFKVAQKFHLFHSLRINLFYWTPKHLVYIYILKYVHKYAHIQGYKLPPLVGFEHWSLVACIRTLTPRPAGLWYGTNLLELIEYLFVCLSIGGPWLELQRFRFESHWWR